MTKPFTDERLRVIIEGQIAEDENLGSQSGSSGHLGHVDYVLDGIDEPIHQGGAWDVTYSYTVIVTTEFTIYPDNPPHENGYRKTITLNDKGDVIAEGEKRFISTNREPEGLPDPAKGDDPHEMEDMIQRVIDPETGRDITAEYITQRLKELEVVADGIIQRAREKAGAAPGKRIQVYKAAHWEIYENLGVGSIGPATAAAGPLMQGKQWELAKALGIDESERLL